MEQGGGDGFSKSPRFSLQWDGYINKMLDSVWWISMQTCIELHPWKLTAGTSTSPSWKGTSFAKNLHFWVPCQFSRVQPRLNKTQQQTPARSFSAAQEAQVQCTWCKLVVHGTYFGNVFNVRTFQEMTRRHVRITRVHGLIHFEYKTWLEFCRLKPPK